MFDVAIASKCNTLAGLLPGYLAENTRNVSEAKAIGILF